MAYVSELRNCAWNVLKNRNNIEGELPDENELMKQIASTVISQSGCLRMDTWHCGTTHCIAGWATVLNPIAQQLEHLTDTEMAGKAILPSFIDWFYTDDRTAMSNLQSVLCK